MTETAIQPEIVSPIRITSGVLGSYLRVATRYPHEDLRRRIMGWCRENDVTAEVIIENGDMIVILIPDHNDAVLCKLACV